MSSSKERITRTSKSLSYLLRHGAAKEKVPMRPDGFVLVDDILKHKKYSNITFEDITIVVKENDKKRFTLQEENGKWYIKANQGHSIPVEDLSLTKITDATTVPVAVHGTYMKAWPDIKKQGLCKMKRNHIHFAIGYKSAEVISGMRTSSEILIYIDLETALKDGIEFFLSENKVVLSSGINGYLPTKYFKYVIKASTGLPFDNDFPTPQPKQNENGNGKSEFLIRFVGVTKINLNQVFGHLGTQFVIRSSFANEKSKFIVKRPTTDLKEVIKKRNNFIASVRKNVSLEVQNNKQKQPAVVKKPKVSPAIQYFPSSEIRIPNSSLKPNQLRTVADVQLHFKRIIPPPDYIPNSFHDLGLSVDLSYALEAFQISKPTLIQAMAIPELLKGNSALCAAQTGTGKTLMYLLPLLQRLWNEETNPDFKRRGQRMRAMILVPTRELAFQTQKVIEKLCQGHPNFKTLVLTSASSEKQQYVAFNDGVDIVISIPDYFKTHYDAGRIYLDSLQYLVIDEADTMFDFPLDSQLKEILNEIKKQSREALQRIQIAVVSATVTKSVLEFATSQLKNVSLAVSPALHKTNDTLSEYFEILRPSDSKVHKLLELLKRSSNKGKSTIVFCNSIAACKSVHDFLKRNNYAVEMLIGGMKRGSRLNEFKRFYTGESRILVATDVAARGLDMSQVDHVIQFDFARTTVVYLHRVGRTARAGAKGKATSFVLPKDKRVLQIIRKASQLRLSVADIEKAIVEKSKKQKEEEQLELASIPESVKKQSAAEFLEKKSVSSLTG